MYCIKKIDHHSKKYPTPLVAHFPTTETDELSTESKDESILITDGTANYNIHEAMNMSLQLCLHLLLPAILYGFSII